MTKIGILRIRGSENGISSIVFADNVKKSTSTLLYLKECLEQLEAYFKGDLKKFNVKLDLKGTDFQIKVWKTLCKTPYGTTISYKKLALKLGDTNKTRAVGLANAKNPVSIIVPCHRVIGHNGDLTGYAWGIEKKKKLLELEHALPQLSLF